MSSRAPRVRRSAGVGTPAASAGSWNDAPSSSGPRPSESSQRLCIGAMFYDSGGRRGHRSEHDRFEVDGANAARDFLREQGVSGDALRIVWDAIALHPTAGLPEHEVPDVALVTSGVECDVLAEKL